MVWDFSLKIKSASINICTKFLNCRWMKMAKSAFQKGWENGWKSGKMVESQGKVSENQGILERILSGNPGFGWEIRTYTFLLRTLN